MRQVDKGMRAKSTQRIEVTSAQVDFCKRRTAFLMRAADTLPITFLLANAYHQGLSDTVEMYEARKIAPIVPTPLFEAPLEP
jgi:hypothetical protein